MNTGVFMEEGERFHVYAFPNQNIDIPFELLENALVKEIRPNYFLITRLKTNEKVTPGKFFVVRDGKKMENPYEITKHRLESLFGKKVDVFEVIKKEAEKKTEFERFREELWKRGFYRADKENFKRQLFPNTYHF